MTTTRFDTRQREFEKNIGYDAALQQHVGNEVVTVDWLKIGPCEGLAQWKIEDAKLTNVNIGNEVDEWTWYYRKPGAAIVVSVTSFRGDELAAMKALSEFANRSNMAPLPYARGPKDLGTISVVFDKGGAYGLFWAFRNLKFEVEGADKAAVTAVAYFLQGIAAASTQPR